MPGCREEAEGKAAPKHKRHAGTSTPKRQSGSSKAPAGSSKAGAGSSRGASGSSKESAGSSKPKGLFSSLWGRRAGEQRRLLGVARAEEGGVINVKRRVTENRTTGRVREGGVREGVRPRERSLRDPYEHDPRPDPEQVRACMFMRASLQPGPEDASKHVLCVHGSWVCARCISSGDARKASPCEGKPHKGSWITSHTHTCMAAVTPHAQDLHVTASAHYEETGHMCSKSHISFTSLAVPAAGPGYAERCERLLGCCFVLPLPECTSVHCIELRLR